MRQIKFKGRSTNTGAWLYGDLIREGIPEVPVYGINYWDEESGWMYDYVYEESVGQFTGVYDRKGREIYEGDVLKVWAKYPLRQQRQGSFTVEWYPEKTGFWLSKMKRAHVLKLETVSEIYEYEVVLKETEDRL